MTPEQEIVVINRHGDPIYATVTPPQHGSTSPAPLLVILHGFKGFRNYSFLPWISQQASSEGMIAIRICFSLNGMRNTSWMVQSTDDFARNTISRECDDVADLVTALEEHPEFHAVRQIWDGTISLLGHSRGGGVALIAAKELAVQQPARLRNVAIWNSVGLWNRWTPRQAAAWKEAGSFAMENQRTGQMLTMLASYVSDIEDHAARMDLTSACAALHGRLRAIHAQHDLTVPLKEIESLLNSANMQVALHIVSQTSHTFGMEHPVQRITQGFVQAIHHTFPWIRQ